MADAPLRNTDCQFVVSSAADHPKCVHVGWPDVGTLCHLHRQFRPWHEGDTVKACQLCHIALVRGAP